MKTRHQLERWLAREILGREIPRKPPGKARRTKALRDPDFRHWISSEHCCCACGSWWSVEAAHVGSDGGMSMKATDELLVPLCSDCHTMDGKAYHRIGRAAFERHTGLDCVALARRLWAEWRARAA